MPRLQGEKRKRREEEEDEGAETEWDTKSIVSIGGGEHSDGLPCGRHVLDAPD